MKIPPTPADPLRQAARRMEAAYLSEMLRAAGLDKAQSAFGGGAGEAQFASFLRQEHATALAERGGIGLADAIYQSLKDRADV